MDIDIRILLIISIVIIGLIFVMLFPILDSSSDEEFAKEDIEVVSTSKHNTIKSSSQTNSNTEIDDKTFINDEETVLETEIVEEEEIVEEVVENEEVLEPAIQVPLLAKRNNAPRVDFLDDEKYVSRKVDYSRMVNAPCTLSYKIPESWASQGRTPGRRENTSIRINIRSLSEFGDYDIYETTYDEFLNGYIEEQGRYSTNSRPNEFRRRNIILSNGEEYPILEELGAYAVTNHMVFVFGRVVLSMEITINNDEYNDEILRKIDNIFASAYIFY